MWGGPFRAAAALLRGMALRTAADDLLAEIDVPVRVVGATHDAMIGLSMPKGTPGRAVPYGLVQGLQ